MTQQTTTALSTEVQVQGYGLSRPHVPSNETIEGLYKMAQYAAESGLAKTTNAFEIHFRMMLGYELGIAPMAAIRTIYAVNGVPTCSGEAMLALIRKSGLLSKLEVSGDDKSCSVTMGRKDTGEEMTFTFTIEKAQRAGLVGKQVWKAYPDKMLKWRAISEGAKFLFSDVIGGLYTVEEISPDTPMDENGNPTDQIIVEKPEPQPQRPPEPTPEPAATSGVQDAELIPDDEPGPTAGLDDAQITTLLNKAQAGFQMSENQVLDALQTARLDHDIPDIKSWPSSMIEAEAALIVAQYEGDRAAIQQYTSSRATNGGEDVWLERNDLAMQICDRIEAHAAAQMPATSKVSEITDGPLTKAQIGEIITHGENLGFSETVVKITLEVDDDDWSDVKYLEALGALNNRALQSVTEPCFQHLEYTAKDHWHAVINPGPAELKVRFYGRDDLRKLADPEMYSENITGPWAGFLQGMKIGETYFLPNSLRIHGKWGEHTTAGGKTYIKGEKGSITLNDIPF